MRVYSQWIALIAHSESFDSRWILSYFINGIYRYFIYWNARIDRDKGTNMDVAPLSEICKIVIDSLLFLSRVLSMVNDIVKYHSEEFLAKWIFHVESSLR